MSGWLENLIIICVMTLSATLGSVEIYPCKPDIFDATYEAVA